MHKQFDLWCISILTNTYTTHQMIEHCNLMSMYAYSKSIERLRFFKVKVFYVWADLGG